MLLNHGHGPEDDRCPFIEMYVLSKENDEKGVFVTEGQFYMGSYFVDKKGIVKDFQEELPEPYLLNLDDFEIYKMFCLLDYN